MTEAETNFYKNIKRSFWQVAVSLSIVVILSLLSFYYNTQSSIKYQDAQIKEIKEKIDVLIKIHLHN
jgi:hypothetical protein